MDLYIRWLKYNDQRFAVLYGDCDLFVNVSAVSLEHRSQVPYGLFSGTLAFCELVSVSGVSDVNFKYFL
jgi:hypothetical protein